MPVLVPDTTPPFLPPGMVVDVPLRERFIASGAVYARVAPIHLQFEDAFERLWLKHKVAFYQRGFTMKEEDGKKLLQQVLHFDPVAKAFSLTANGEQRLRFLSTIPTTRKAIVAPVFSELPNGLEKILWDYQRLPARQIYRSLRCGRDEWGYPGAVDLSDMGTGKTAMDLAAALATGRKIIILCPKVGENGWREMLARFGAEPYFIGTYEALRGGYRSHIVDMSGPMPKWHHASDIIIIFDEAQALRHDDTLNVKCCAAAINQGIPMITASATIAVSPLELRFAGRITGLHAGGADWDKFLARHGCSRRTPSAPWVWNKDLMTLDMINNALFPRRGARIRKEDLGDKCPETKIEVLPFATTEAAEIEDMWRKTIKFFADERRRGLRTDADIKRAEFSAYQKIWMTSEMALIPHIANRIIEDIDSGRSVAAFLSFNQSRIALAGRFKTSAGFYGGQDKARRSYWEKEFQANRTHLLVNNIRAGGASVSLHDTTGDRPRTAYVFPTDRVIDMQQATGRIDRVGGMTLSLQYIPCFAGSVTMDMVERTRQKMLQISTLNNGSNRATMAF